MMPTVAFGVTFPGGRVYCRGPEPFKAIIETAMRAFSEASVLSATKATFRVEAPTAGGIEEPYCVVMLNRSPEGVILAGAYADRNPISKSLRRIFRRIMNCFEKKPRQKSTHKIMKLGDSKLNLDAPEAQTASVAPAPVADIPRKNEHVCVTPPADGHSQNILL